MTDTQPDHRRDVEDNEDARQERLRRNTSFDPQSKSIEELDSMHPDSWAGGSINPQAKQVARGEAPANQERGSRMPADADIPVPTEKARPWAPSADDDPSGRDRKVGD